MAIIKASALLSLLSLFAFDASSAECSPQQVQNNKMNNFILFDEQPSADTPKAIEITIESRDGFIHSSVSAIFSRCGELIKADFANEKNYQTGSRVLTATYSAEINKKEYGWKTNLQFDNAMTDKDSKKRTELFSQQVEGVVLLGKNGVISKSGERFEAMTGNLKQIGVANTSYRFDASERLLITDRRSNLRSDNAKTVYEYDARGRLLQKRSASVLDIYSYDQTGRELSLTSTATYFTIEKTVTTCQEWNEFGKCTLAHQRITITTPNARSGVNSIQKHDAILKTSISYWE
ncbi:hypothetical protein AAGR08_22880 (plasmid) [Pantoea sp. BRR-3P]|uniref:hypothetical protein n=1 Tax=Pantoea sp. BRR-3P TaxID=3141541 RepID=UPI0031F52A26